jgi:hypothetical protein
MNLYIEIENGQPKNHPAFEENLIQAFGVIPENWETFVRLERPIPNIYQILVSNKSTYEKVNGVWTDVWQLRDMTNEEKQIQQQEVRDFFNSREQHENWSAWTLDEATCTMIPPIPRPEKIEGVLVFWCGAENNWKVAPNRPTDDKEYKFDFFAWQWNEVTNV